MPMFTTVWTGLPLPAADLLGERVHLVQLGVHVRVDVLTVHVQRWSGAGRAAERGVQHGPVLGDVDVRTGEHLLDPPREADLISKLEEQFHGAVADQVLGQVHVQVRGAEAVPLRTVGLGVEPGAQVRGEGVLVGVQAGPGAGAGGVDRCGGHCSSSGGRRVWSYRTGDVRSAPVRPRGGRRSAADDVRRATTFGGDGGHPRATT